MFLRKKYKQSEYHELIEDISDIKLRLESVESRFNFLLDEDLIESCIYEEKSLLARYSYLMKEAKCHNVTNSNYERVTV